MFENTHLQQSNYTANQFFTGLPKSLPTSDNFLMKGESLFNRENVLIGYSFNLDVECSECANKDFISPHHLEIMTSKLNRLLKKFKDRNLLLLPFERNNKNTLIIKTSLRLLLENKVFNLLNEACNQLKNEQFNVLISFDVGNLITKKECRKLWECIYKLNDNNIKFILSEPPSKIDNFIVSNSIFPIISVTPEWLGINSSEDCFDLSKYISSVSLLSNFIYEYGKNIILEGISTAWHQSFISCLPAKAYTIKSNYCNFLV